MAVAPAVEEVDSRTHAVGMWIDVEALLCLLIHIVVLHWLVSLQGFVMDSYGSDRNGSVTQRSECTPVSRQAV